MKPIGLVLLGLVLGQISLSAVPVLWPANGHYYEFVRFDSGSQSNTWSEVEAAARGRVYSGMTGHLATITSLAENDFVTTNFFTEADAQGAWLGGRAPENDGVWRWMAGPEAGRQFGDGGQATAPDHFVHWGGVEPNHAQDDENYLVLNLGWSFADIEPGEWWDAVWYSWPNDPVVGYVVEYEPLAAGAFERPTLTITLEDTSIRLQFFALTNRSYQVLYSTNLASTNWLPLSPAAAGADATMLVTDDLGHGPQRSYRVTVLP